MSDWSEINFSNLDKYLRNLPKDITHTIYDYYTEYCKNCDELQTLCFQCKRYKCPCDLNLLECDVNFHFIKDCELTYCPVCFVLK